MVIRRIREHAAAQNWFAVGIDLAIVVAGVFLGTQVNNWNEERIENDRGRDYLARLITELDFDARQYALQIAYYRQVRTYGLQALSALDGAPVSDRDFVIAAYQLTQTDTTKAKTGVFDEMAANGLGEHLGDDETQQLASDFYLSVEVAQRTNETIYPYRTLLRETMPYAVQTRVRRECGDRNVFYQKRVVGIQLVVPCPMAMTVEEAADAAAAVKAAPEIRRQMVRYIASIDEKLDNLEFVGAQAVQFRDRLKADERPRAS
ncbi:hypothetical protein H9L13_01910 [Sphingomonas lutea]|uniref:Uncharacterized protein n=1 Tax=Sphingomonas lutea TaxID=1045317 RepID=A0A7G9SIP6_9SPHN|nr:hypothetical protein [Sphingomonas lutea]QNN67721.1 hypothetical protein H9L13_01910 [Sphingomonas lutea]